MAPPTKRTYTIDDNGCWIWDNEKGLDKDGYARLTHKGKWIPAYRFFYEIAFGKIPDGLTCDHLCRNRRCVNPHHIEPVTNAENIRRSPLKTPLDWGKVRDIKLCADVGFTHRVIAEQFGVCRQTVDRVIREETWCSP